VKRAILAALSLEKIAAGETGTICSLDNMCGIHL